jgi:hypothetical protein
LLCMARSNTYVERRQRRVTSVYILASWEYHKKRGEMLTSAAASNPVFSPTNRLPAAQIRGTVSTPKIAERKRKENSVLPASFIQKWSR